MNKEQYHAGLDQLWHALGLTEALDEDVFTLSAQAITRGRDLAAAVKEAYATINHLTTLGDEGYRQGVRDTIAEVRELVELTPDTGCLTPRQVKEGTAKVSEALGLHNCDPSLIFTMAASAIDYSKHLERIIRVQNEYGPLSQIFLYPCPECNKYTINEWYGYVPVQHREMSPVEVNSQQEARDLYIVFFGVFIESHYITQTDSYTNNVVDGNFIVTGGSCHCSEHKT